MGTWRGKKVEFSVRGQPLRRNVHDLHRTNRPNIHQPAIASGEPKSLLELSVAEAGDAFIGAGLIDEPTLETTLTNMRRANKDPNVLALMPPMTQVWARRAV